MRKGLVLHGIKPVEKKELKKKKKILVVDDYLPTRRLIAEALEQQGKYEVTEAENGLEALDKFNISEYDLVISDIMMPGMSGMDLLHAMIKRNPAISVIMITAHTAPEMTVSAIKEGAVDFLQKPFDIDDLIFKCEIYLRNGYGSRAERETLRPDHSPLIMGMKKDLSIHQYIYEEIEAEHGTNEAIFRKIADLALKIVSGSAAYLLIYDQDANELRIEAAQTTNGELGLTGIPDSWRGFLKLLLKAGKGVVINAEDNPLVPHSMICAPLMIRSKPFGLLVLCKAKSGRIFTSNDLNLILSLTKRASLNLENKLLYESIYGNLLDTFGSLVASIQARDHYTEKHSRRIATMSVTLAEEMAFSDSEIESIKIAAALHDIGKIAVPDNILLKPGKLTQGEFLVMKNHSAIGESILQSVSLLGPEKKIVRYHHERWDGKGYPDGLSGLSIPFPARLLTVVDAYDAMVNLRPYRQNALSPELAAAELKKGRGTQFDGEVVDIFLNKVLLM